MSSAYNVASRIDVEETGKLTKFKTITAYGNALWILLMAISHRVKSFCGTCGTTIRELFQRSKQSC